MNDQPKTGYILTDGQIVEVEILWQREGTDRMLIAVPGRSPKYIDTSVEAVYPDRETPLRILNERRKQINDAGIEGTNYQNL